MDDRGDSTFTMGSGDEAGSDTGSAALITFLWIWSAICVTFSVGLCWLNTLEDFWTCEDFCTACWCFRCCFIASVAASFEGHEETSTITPSGISPFAVRCRSVFWDTFLLSVVDWIGAEPFGFSGSNDSQFNDLHTADLAVLRYFGHTFRCSSNNSLFSNPSTQTAHSAFFCKPNVLVKLIFSVGRGRVWGRELSLCLFGGL